MDLSEFAQRVLWGEPAPARRRPLLERNERPTRLSAGEGLITGVVVLGLTSRNRRHYSPEAARAAVPLYHNTPVYIDHPEDPREHRSVKDRIGKIINPRWEGGKVRADLRYNPKHPFAPALEWAAEHEPGMLGLSHNVEAEGLEEEDGFTVSRIGQVRSVDVVAEPATTRGLFESAGHFGDPEHELPPSVPCSRLRSIAKNPDYRGDYYALLGALEDEINYFEPEGGFGDDEYEDEEYEGEDDEDPVTEAIAAYSDYDPDPFTEALARYYPGYAPAPHVSDRHFADFLRNDPPTETAREWAGRVFYGY